jgi:hypothetical protein
LRTNKKSLDFLLCLLTKDFVILFYTFMIYTMTMKNPQGLKDALASIEKQFGKGAVIRMGDSSNVGLVNTFHSGSYILDLIL